MIRLALDCARVSEARRDKLIDLAKGPSFTARTLCGMLATGDRSPADCLAEVAIALIEIELTVRDHVGAAEWRKALAGAFSHAIQSMGRTNDDASTTVNGGDQE